MADPKVRFDERLRCCTNCMYCRVADVIGPDHKLIIGEKIHTCQYMPPTPVLLPNPQGGATLTPTFPIVNERISCAQHTFEDDLIEAPMLDS